MGERRLCPICGRIVPRQEWEATFRPFCSPRCKKIDLGSWLDGSYRISRPLAEEDLDQGPSRDGADDGGRRSDGDA